MSGQRILVTGQGGFIGRSLGRLLQSKMPGTVINHEGPIPFGDAPRLASWLQECKPTTIFHFASHSGDASSSTGPLLEALLKLKSSARVVLPGSAAEYGIVPLDQLPVREEFVGDPLTAYGTAKQSQTRLGVEYARRGLHVVTARIFNIIGKAAPEHTLIGSFLSKIRVACTTPGNKTVTVGDLDIKRDLVDIEDVCEGLALVGQFGSTGQVYNICSGSSVALRPVLQQMVTAADPSIQIVADSPLIAKNAVRDIYGSLEKTRATTGWSARYHWQEAVSRLFA